jgi:hypothetical protein
MPLERSPFALIRYSIDGQEPRYGLRLDLDKQVFLDYLGDSEKDAVIARAAPKIVAFLRAYLLKEGLIAPAR